MPSFVCVSTSIQVRPRLNILKMLLLLCLIEILTIQNRIIWTEVQKEVKK